MRKYAAYAIFVLLIFPFSVFAQADEKPEWNNELVSGVNKEKACQVEIPFDSETQALQLSTEESPYYQTLNGTWKFHWAADPKDRPVNFYLPDYNVSTLISSQVLTL